MKKWLLSHLSLEKYFEEGKTLEKEIMERLGELKV